MDKRLESCPVIALSMKSLSAGDYRVSVLFYTHSESSFLCMILTCEFDFGSFLSVDFFEVTFHKNHILGPSILLFDVLDIISCGDGLGLIF